MSKAVTFAERPKVEPKIYAYSDSRYPGLLKVGYTTRNVEARVAEQYPIKSPYEEKPYQVVFQETAMYIDGGSFTDHDVHRMLASRGCQREEGEWFQCTKEDVEAALLAVRTRSQNIENRTQSFKMRPEQARAVAQTKRYYEAMKKAEPGKCPKFLWNAKMRFGKTFAAYQLAKRMGLQRILILTFKPAVESAWAEDLAQHIDFECWQFVSNNNDTGEKIDKQFKNANKKKPIVAFGSFQDLLGTNDSGGIKAKNEFIHTINWDLVIFDEYHFGAWRDSAKKLFADLDEEEELDAEEYAKKESGNAINETSLPITTDRYLFLSGTPFRALMSGEFIEEQIFNWTYADEQRAKENWPDKETNPYLELPRMVMLTYKVPETISAIAREGEFDAFDLNEFFAAEGKDKKAKFKHQNEVQKWLDLIRGAYMPSTKDDLKLGQEKRPPMPYSDTRLMGILSHTLWFLPNVASCDAMENLLHARQNVWFSERYTIVNCSGTKAGIGLEALKPVKKAIGDPLKTQTITLSCGKLTTGVTVAPWAGVFMLRNLKSPETYFQTAFRVQSPWTIPNESGKRTILKEECYVFDFALDRALTQISDYSCRLDANEANPEKKVEEFINFLPVLAYADGVMKQVNAEEILDYTSAGTSATLLARRWESALLVNVDNETLKKLLSSEPAMKALERIEGFRSLNQDLKTIINKSESVKKKLEKGKKLTPKEKKELTAAEKEYKSKRREIQEKLIKFATRVPIFMYLTDNREKCLKDVITEVEPQLFRKVTGLDVRDFDLLVSIGVFNANLMNDAIYKFKRYEDASLSYTGIDKTEGKDVGGWDTVLRRAEYDALFKKQQSQMQN